MKFSIVITTYNRLPLLKRAIESALAQTIPCEVVVADDGSNDGTQEFVSDWVKTLGDGGNRRLVYHVNPRNVGHSETMNAGVRVATGEWIKPLDDDDYLANNCIEEMAKAIALRPEAVICSAQAIQVDSNGVELSHTRQIGPGQIFYIPQEDIHYGMLVEQVPFGTPVQVAFRKDAFERSGGWDSQLDGNCDDIDSWIRLTQYGDALFINQCLAYRTIWAGAYNQKISVRTRLDTNLLMKQRIYTLVNPKYQWSIPEFSKIRGYLKLHWSLVALKQGKVLTGIQTAFPAFFSMGAWKLLINAILARNRYFSEPTGQGEALKRDRPEESRSSVDEKERIAAVRQSLRWRWGRTAISRGQILLGLNLMRHSFCQLFRSNSDRHLYPQLPEVSPKQKLTANVRLIDNLYNFTTQKHRSQLPKIYHLRAYVRLRWGWTTLKQGNLWAGIQLLFPSLFSIPAWKIWCSVARNNHTVKLNENVRKVTLL
jgi:glycosyltransferase involved in cell wall biosynthesis